MSSMPLNSSHLDLRILRVPFFQQLVSNGVSRDAIALLDRAGARDPYMALAVLTAFPSLAREGHLDAAMLSYGITSVAPMAASIFQQENAASEPLPVALGAVPPRSSAWQIDARVSLTDADGDVDADAAAVEAAAVDAFPGMLVQRCGPWPVRDQGQRGSCVAFATAAVRELMDCQSGAPFVDLSEEFLYMAIKDLTTGPAQTIDGSTYAIAMQAMAQYGICTELLCLYDSTVVPGDPGHLSKGWPASSQQLADGLRRSVPNLVYAAPAGTGGKAALVLSHLRGRGVPVAITVPVFVDSAAPRGAWAQNNWSTTAAWNFGAVADPVPTSVVDGGHAVCIVGFEEDATEPKGGYFVFRNSWGEAWARRLPFPGYAGPETGYGQISASYIDKYLWELLTF